MTGRTPIEIAETILFGLDWHVTNNFQRMKIPFDFCSTLTTDISKRLPKSNFVISSWSPVYIHPILDDCMLMKAGVTCTIMFENKNVFEMKFEFIRNQHMGKLIISECLDLSEIHAKDGKLLYVDPKEKNQEFINRKEYCYLDQHNDYKKGLNDVCNSKRKSDMIKESGRVKFLKC